MSQRDLSNISFYSSDEDSDNDWQMPERRKSHFNVNYNTNDTQRKFPQRHIMRQVYKKDQKRENHKKMLCKNVIHNGKCDYSHKCCYAHVLPEQNVDLPRKKILDILEQSDLSWLDLNEEKEIYKNIMILTKMCDDCAKNKCTGGYNCKWGACIPDILVCYDDLNYGNCNLADAENEFQCKLIHLTKKGLKPYYLAQKNFKNKNNVVDSNNQFGFTQKYGARSNSLIGSNTKNISGTLLTEEFFLHLTNNNYIKDSEITHINEEEDSSDDDCERSIFYDKISKMLNE